MTISPRINRRHAVLRGFLIAVLIGTVLILPRISSATLLHSLITARQLGTSYTPAELQTAYDFSPLYDQGVDGSGQTVALIEIDTFDEADIRYFDSVYSLADPTIKEVYVGGRQFPMNDDGESTMDIEWLHALAPGAGVQVYYLNNHQSNAGVWRAMNSALKQVIASGVKIVSISLSSCGRGPGTSLVQATLKSAVKSGVSIFVSSGDTGDRPGRVKDCGKKIGVGYPAADPSVVSVGGTSLHLDDDNLISRELAWKKSGGGRATGFARPSWQKAHGLPKDSLRWAPDVSFLGDPNTGVSVYYNGRFHQAGGTSLGAPGWAAIWALIRQSADVDGAQVGPAPRALYRVGNSSSYADAFHDITTGSNGHYTAGVGWDPVTGWGTPDVANLSQSIEGL